MDNRYVLIGLAMFVVFISSGCISESVPNLKYISNEDKKLEWQEGCYYYGPRDVWICDNYQPTKEFIQSIPSDELTAANVSVVGIAHTTENYVLAYAVLDYGEQVTFFEIYDPSEDTTHDLGYKEDVEKLGITVTSYETIIRHSDLDRDGYADEIDAFPSEAKYHSPEELKWQEGCYYYGPRDVWICDNYQATKKFVQSIPTDYLISSDIDVVGIAHTTGNYVLVYAIPDIGSKVPFFEIYEPSEDWAHDLGSKEEVEELGITITSYELVTRLSDLEDDGYANDMDTSSSYVEEEVNVTSGFYDENTTTYDNENGQIVEVTTENQEDWCPVGTSWKTSNPTTGEEISMIYTGTKEVHGIRMCVMEYTSTNPEDDIARVEYMFSEDSETFSWKSYYANGTVQSEMTMKDGKMTIMSEDGQVTEFESN